MYEHQLNMKKTEEAGQALFQKNSDDVRLSENKVSQECGTPRSKVLAIKDKFEGFNQNKNKRKVECREKISGEKKENVRKKV